MQYETFKESRLFGRYINHLHLEPVVDGFKHVGEVAAVGYSVRGLPINMLTIGSGKIKVLLWSQMHGNESTTTKALIDVLRYLENSHSDILDKLTLYCLPMLNPDGAFNYTRENANKFDINRDFVAQEQPETQTLMKVYADINPDFCFNLHDQRTIFGAGYSGKPATVSFLSPSFNQAADMSETRVKAIAVINAMNRRLQSIIPGQVGRFDDTYNPNCAGDTFQSLNTPTILIEAGHFHNDYNREETRRLVCEALIAAFNEITRPTLDVNSITEYLHIPKNIINFFDFVYNNVRFNYDSNDIITNFAVQYIETLDDGKISFEAKIVEVGALLNIFGHYQFDAKAQLYRDHDENIPKVAQKADFFIGKTKFSNGKIEEF